MIVKVERDEKNNNNNSSKTTQHQQQQRPTRRTLYCIGCGSTKEADYIVGVRNLPLCHEHWEVFASVVLERRSVQEEQELV